MEVAAPSCRWIHPSRHLPRATERDQQNCDRQERIAQKSRSGMDRHRRRGGFMTRSILIVMAGELDLVIEGAVTRSVNREATVHHGE